MPAGSDAAVKRRGKVLVGKFPVDQIIKER